MRRKRVAGLLAVLMVAACSSSPAPSGSAGSGSGSESVSADAPMDHSTMAMGSASAGAAPPPEPSAPSVSSSVSPSVSPSGPPATSASVGVVDVLPGMPPVTDPSNIYSDAGANMLGPAAQRSKAYAYVPNTKSGDVWVIDAQTFQVVDKFHVGIEVQHVVPSWDMSALYATDDQGDVIRRIDPVTGEAGDTIPVVDPYNMYFTPDGKSAISVAEKYRTLVWYDPTT